MKKSKEHIISDWQCEICKKKFPDSEITVTSFTHTLAGVPVGRNVRHCNNPKCVKKALEMKKNNVLFSK